MDSLTQITLGAAVGEIVLGKKIGNRALLWGAIAGTIPDLDVLSGPFVTELQGLVYHRGISHSILFAIIGSFVFAWLVRKMYTLHNHHYLASILWFSFPVGVCYFLSRFELGISPLLGIVLLILTGLILYNRYFKRVAPKPDATYAQWVQLFFWGLMTHPILDCFTTYGTQLFQPFSSYRVAFNTISVADPLYTIPFLICIVILAFLAKSNALRRTMAWGGIALSSIYMIWCLSNKRQVHQVLIHSLNQQDISYHRVMTSPTILNNILWYCLAETNDGYYSGLYSLWDENKEVKLSFTPRNDSMLRISDHHDDTIETLKWFSNNYYSISELDEGVLQFNDMRFGKFDDAADSKSYIFNFPIKANSEGYYELTQVNGGPPPRDREKALKNLWDRLRGD